MPNQPKPTTSVWMATAAMPSFPKLDKDISEIDVCIVGAGIIGLTTALLLLLEGKSVIILDDGPIAAGETQRTTAHITYVLDKRYFDIERIHGSDSAKLVAGSQFAAVQKIASIVKQEQIDCDFTRLDGYLFAADDQSHETLQKELETVRKLGFEDVSSIKGLPFTPSTETLKFPGQAKFHVLKYLSSLCNSIQQRGGIIHAFEHVQKIEDGERVTVQTASGHKITAQFLVVATNSPISDWIKVHTKQAAYRTYVIGMPVPSKTVPDALFWDTAEPYHYIRLQPTDSPNTDLLIVGGEDHRTGQANDGYERFQRLENWTRQFFPQAGPVNYRWSGQIYEPEDGLAFIGRDPAHGHNVLIATGTSGNGMTNGTVAGMILRDLVCDQENPWVKVYDPRRKPFKAPLQFFKENINTISQYAKKLEGSEVASIDDIPPGEGAVIRRHGEQIAVYKDDHGQVHEASATCTHLGGTVCWNSCEKSWDCGVHGSRFDALGQVIDGPANSNLESPKEQQQDQRRAS